MSGRALSKKQRATRNKLLLAGKTITKDGGYRSVTMNSVAELAKVSRITAYNYFDNKDHLLSTIIAEQLADFEKNFTLPEEVMSSSPPAILSQGLYKFISFLYTSPNLLQALVNSANSLNSYTINLAGYLKHMVPERIGLPLKRLSEAEKETLCLHLGFQIHSIIINLANDQISLHEAMQYTGDAVELLWSALTLNGIDSHSRGVVLIKE